MATKVSSPTIKPEPDSTSTPPTEWDEKLILSSLARLQEMHIQLRQLRPTVPYLISAFHTPNASPQALYKELAFRATNAVKNVQGFAALMREPRTQGLLERARESKGQDGRDIKSWLERTVEEDVRELRIDEEEESKMIDSGVESNLENVLGRFREKHSDVEVSLEENDQKLKVSLPPPTQIKFYVDLNAKHSNNTVCPVTCEWKSQRAASILRAIATRTKADSLPYLLEMLASYSDILSKPCQRCDQLFDYEAQFPVVRASRTIEMPDGSHTTLWDALHLGCVKG